MMMSLCLSEQTVASLSSRWYVGVEVDVLICVRRFAIDVKGPIRFMLVVDVEHMDVAVDLLLHPCYVRMHVVDVRRARRRVPGGWLLTCCQLCAARRGWSHSERRSARSPP